MTSISRRLFNLGLGTSILALGVGAAFAQEPLKGGSVTLAVSNEPPTLVSLTTTAQTAVIVSPKVTEGLLTYDFDLTPKPQLATEWSVSPDGLNYTFKLREGVLWHDGTPFTSQDVAFSLMLLKKIHPRGQSTFQSLAEVQTPDPLTAVLVLSKPTPYLLTALLAAESPIVPRHIYEASGDDVASNPNEVAPIGTGPFIFKEWVRGSHVLYAANPNYWDAGKPHIDQLVVRFITDASSRAAALETGEVDIAGWTPVPLSDVERLAQSPVVSIESRGNEYQNNQFYRIEFNTQNTYFSNQTVRQAIAHALDKQAILDIVFLSHGVVAKGPISPNLTQFHAPDIQDLSYDPAVAEALLDEAGYPRGADGIRFHVTIDGLAGLAARIAEYTRDALGRIGIGVTVRTEDLSSYVQRTYTTRDFDFNAQGSTQMFDPTVGTQRFYWSKNFRPGVPYSNGAAYANPDVDRLLESAAVEVDVDKRRGYFAQFQQIVLTEAPAIGLVAASQLTIANKRLVNHTVSADGISANFAELYIQPK